VEVEAVPDDNESDAALDDVCLIAPPTALGVAAAAPAAGLPPASAGEATASGAKAGAGVSAAVTDPSTATFTVERIVAARGQGKLRRYLVKWEGYDDASNTWEPASHLHEALVYDFEHAHNKAKSTEAAFDRAVVALGLDHGGDRPRKKRGRPPKRKVWDGMRGYV